MNKPSRRAVVRTGVWAVPVVATASMAPGLRRLRHAAGHHRRASGRHASCPAEAPTCLRVPDDADLPQHQWAHAADHDRQLRDQRQGDHRRHGPDRRSRVPDRRLDEDRSSSRAPRARSGCDVRSPTSSDGQTVTTVVDFGAFHAVQVRPEGRRRVRPGLQLRRDRRVTRGVSVGPVTSPTRPLTPPTTTHWRPGWPPPPASGCSRYARAGLTGRELKDAGDQAAHELLVDLLAQHRPDDAVLSEEGKDDKRRLGSRPGLDRGPARRHAGVLRASA